MWGLDNTIQYNTQTHTEHLLSILPHPPTHPQPLAASTSQAGTAPSGPTAQQAPSAARWTSRSTDQEPWYEASKMDSYFKLATSLVLWISLPAAQDNIIYLHLCSILILSRLLLYTHTQTYLPQLTGCSLFPLNQYYNTNMHTCMHLHVHFGTHFLKFFIQINIHIYYHPYHVERDIASSVHGYQGNKTSMQIYKSFLAYYS